MVTTETLDQAARDIAAGGSTLETGRRDMGHSFIRMILDGTTYNAAVNELTRTFKRIDVSAVYKTVTSARNSILARVGSLLKEYTDAEQEIVMAAGYRNESQSPFYKADKKAAAKAVEDATAKAVKDQFDPTDAVGMLRRAAELVEKAATTPQVDAVSEQGEYGRVANGLRSFKTARATKAAQTA